MTDITMIIGGPQGGGIESAGQIALKTLVKKGFNVLGSREYQSNIMGAHSYYMLRASEKRPGSVRIPVDVVIALDAESVLTHYDHPKPGGYLIYDLSAANTQADRIASMPAPLKARLKQEFEKRGMKPTVSNAVKVAEEEYNVKPLGLPLKQMLKTVAEKSNAPLKNVSKTINTMGLAAGLYILGIEPEYIYEGIATHFAAKKKIVPLNLAAAEVAIGYVKDSIGEVKPLPDGPHKGKVRMIASGNDLVAMGKIVAGIGVQTYYPITPSSDEALYLEKNRYFKVREEAQDLIGAEKANVAVLQTEDELAAVMMAIGAASAGARASTTTSGPGFSLMNEAISMAVATETPLVITLWMRGGPSTGLPTREGQQDLLHALFSGHGDAPKIVIASGNHIEAYYDAITAFNLAEEFQTPVIHLVDKYLASSMISLDREEIDPDKALIRRGKIVENPPADYKRYEITEDGISPRAFVGTAPMIITGLEHTEYGYATEDPVVRDEMMEKRARKWKTIEESIPEDERAKYYGPDDPEILLVSWGSTRNIILSALDLLADEGINAGFLQIRFFMPFPVETVTTLTSKARKTILVEQNQLLQAGLVTRMFTGVKIPHAIVKTNGRPLFDTEVVFGVKRILETGEEKVVVRGGA